MATDSAQARFLQQLMGKYHCFIEEMFNDLVKSAGELLPNFGSVLAADAKALHSFSNRQSGKKADGRCAIKAYQGINADGTLQFGYQLRLTADSKYELPVHYQSTAVN
ncbi:MAG: hypothetical protein GX335_02335 [Firmicutes bacterium]|nr:hypothetical protein [Bacillota bacterium]